MADNRTTAMAKIEMEVAGGLATIEFRPGSCTGPNDSDTSPGIGFYLIDRSGLNIPGKDGTRVFGTGVISRTDAQRLRDELEIFLKACARGDKSAA
jgi:hypothetical protein